MLSFAIFSFLTTSSLFELMIDPTLVSFAFANWMLFNIFEFGRKSFATSEERKNVDTYSSLFGRIGAVTLVASQAIIAHYLALNLTGANQSILFWSFGALLVILMMLSLIYVYKDTVKSAKNYRAFSSVYIIVFYLILIGAHLIKN